MGDSDIQHSDYRSFVMDTFKRNLTFFGKTTFIHPIEVFSDDFFKLWENGAVVSDVFKLEVQLGGNMC